MSKSINRSRRKPRITKAAALKAWRAVPASSKREVTSYFEAEAGSSEEMARDPESWTHRTTKQHRADARGFRAAAALLKAATKRTR